jgi:predicted regulator of Ras-like GTPase activity (Roadblock/LC7/MglB family)
LEDRDQMRGITGWARPYVSGGDVLYSDLFHSDRPAVAETSGDGSSPAGSRDDTSRTDSHLDGPDEQSRPTEGRTGMSKQEELALVIHEIRRSIPELHGVMIASTDGLAIGSDFPEAEAERIAAMAATALGLGKRITDRTGLGSLQETVVRGDHGYLVVYAAGENAVLVMSGPVTSNLGLMRIEARSASRAVSKVLS